VVVIKSQQMRNQILLSLIALLISQITIAQSDTTDVYKKRVLASNEIDFMYSYYTQDGNKAAVSGGIGTEKLTDAVPTIIIAIPINDDDVLTIDAAVSAYTSASSSNINPFDGKQSADPFLATSGASGSDTWVNVNGSYSHSSDDRNKIWSAKASIATEYDYFSAGVGGTYTQLFNKKNTEITAKANIFIDSWTTIYPIELRPFENNRNERGITALNYRVISGALYSPTFDGFTNTGRNSYSAGLTLIQILSKKMQGALLVDLVYQQGLLSTPFQRVYFSDVDSSFIGNFRLADDIERLPGSRFKTALGGRLNYYVNEHIVLKTFYRFYNDDWGVASHTVSLDVPIKIGKGFTLYPGFRFYNQSAASYFAPYAKHLSTDEFYTSDFDLSEYNSKQYSFGISYTDLFTKKHIMRYGLKSIDLKYSMYERNTGLKASLISFGVKFVLDKKKTGLIESQSE
tara:strand:+ start:1191 stop:2564 length:1374 start_codon:yes stop_codon:yes gene_type:complete